MCVGEKGYGESGSYRAGIIHGNRRWLCARLSSPVFAQSLVAWIKANALVDACGGRVPGFDKFAFVFGRFSFNHGSPVPVKCLTGNETM